MKLPSPGAWTPMTTILGEQIEQYVAHRVRAGDASAQVTSVGPLPVCETAAVAAPPSFTTTSTTTTTLTVNGREVPEGPERDAWLRRFDRARPKRTP